MTSHLQLQPQAHQGLGAGALLAHPLVQHTDGLSPLLVAVLAVAVVLTVATRKSSTGAPRAARSEVPVESWAGTLSPGQVVTRAVAVGLLLVAIVAGRLGSPLQLRNIAPALVIGLAWPLLVLGSALLGPVWRWADPWDALARPAGRRAGGGSTDEPPGDPGDVRPAVLPALAWVWYLSVFPDSLDPRSVGAGLAAYSIATVAGCLAFGRKRWLSRAEVFGILFSWIARLPRRRLLDWHPPRGAEAILGVLAGGLLFGAVRRSSLWGALNVAPLAVLYATAGLLGACAATTAFLWAMGRWSSRHRSPGATTAAAVPAVASLAVAIGMARNRLFTLVQLLPGVASDPFGLGWDLFGTADWALNPDPFGHVGLSLLQLLVLVAGHLAGAWVLSHRVDLPHRTPGVVALGVLVGSAALAVTVT